MNGPISTMALRLPEMVMVEVNDTAARVGVGPDEFIREAIEARLEFERLERVIAARRGKSDPEAFMALMSREGGEPPRPGDELPEGMTWESLFPNRP